MNDDKTPIRNNDELQVTGKDSDKKNVKKSEEDVHPIAAAIDKLIHRISDIRLSLQNFLLTAMKWQSDEMKRWLDVLVKSAPLLEDENNDMLQHAIATKNIVSALSNLTRLEKSEMLEMFKIGHFLTLFTSFDAFTGELLTAIYKKKPEIYKSLKRSMSISEMLEYDHIDDIKGIILQSEIEDFRRESYVKQFTILETQFGVKLKEFPNWSTFVECAQRRNLFTHCDGNISDQYISICRQEGFPLQESIIAGKRLDLTPEYLFNSCNLLIEVGFKLGQTLWRKLFPDEISNTDSHLIDVQFRFLQQEKWQLSLMAGEYANNLQKYSTNANKTIMIINYAISLKQLNQTEKLQKLLGSIDWSALCYEFKLAEKVLGNDYDSAKELMTKISRQGEYFSEHAYHSWPLFREFRQSSQFLDGYKDVYGYQFSDKLKESVEKTSKKVEKEVEREENTEEAKKIDDIKIESEE
ncbi:MAG: hypothetical protein PHF37_05140 [Phycisphaerae bacterium]|nr:hypothetical protein [Phycisphaerae bacterium]